MFSCKFCEKETCYTTNFCDKTCRKIKNIANVYGFEEVLEVLEKVCLRNEKQRQYKINKELKEEIEEKVGYFKKEKELGDETYNKPKTRSKNS